MNVYNVLKEVSDNESDPDIESKDVIQKIEGLSYSKVVLHLCYI
jgi:hypothetical protein